MRKLTSMTWIVFSAILVLDLSILSGFAFDATIEEAVLKGNWQEIFEMLEKDNTKVSDPVARLIMAHACLATNRNNASMLLFLSVKEEGDLKAWSAWTESLLVRDPQNSVALYLSADAKVRIGKLKEAMEELTEALKMKEDFALALNARGVIYVLTDEWDNALMNLLQATKSAPELADAHANLGTYWILRESTEGALEAFKEAIAINPEFALAYNGMGCAYFGKGEFEEAAQDFNIASQLSPVLSIAEINQGFAYTYASQLITLASMDKKPGTTLQSVFQQYQANLQNRQPEVIIKGVHVSDPQFWNKMRAWPNLANLERQNLINTHGLANVQTALSHVIEDEAIQTVKWHREVMAHTPTIRSLANTSTLLGGIKLAVSTTLTGIGAARDLYKAGGWEPYFEKKLSIPGERAIAKTAMSRLIENDRARRFLDVVPTSPNLPGLASAATNAWLNRSDVRLKDQLAGHMTRQANALDHQLFHANRLQGLLNTFPRAAEITVPKVLGQLSSPIPNYLHSTDRPLTELGNLASMVNKSIKPIGDLPRSALIVSQDSFRSSLLQSELSKYGFQTTVVPSGTDLQTVAKQLGANVVLGIKQSEQLMLDQRKYSFFPPSGGGGAAAGIRQIQPTIVKPMWPEGNWKSLIPSYPKGMPGGVSTEEIARAFVDKGNWPVMTSFGLFYQAAPSTKEQDQKGNK